eukprot:gnl/TRDRNA2_/TRDRNA2_64727_c0_seq1.p1 gnl/TRDRNA2_/TRDRNA2_64727_c0~~gnl/TRDRNA2_/TRDRNA2_64727_c0_seq1.p1  ORF type:complete len:272 (+),score=36.39 gnl/TRDRNA2_/TRDRNA2_64727_c0_seq1:55-870(+)
MEQDSCTESTRPGCDLVEQLQLWRQEEAKRSQTRPLIQSFPVADRPSALDRPTAPKPLESPLGEPSALPSQSAAATSWGSSAGSPLAAIECGNGGYTTPANRTRASAPSGPSPSEGSEHGLGDVPAFVAPSAAAAQSQQDTMDILHAERQVRRLETDLEDADACIEWLEEQVRQAQQVGALNGPAGGSDSTIAEEMTLSAASTTAGTVAEESRWQERVRTLEHDLRQEAVQAQDLQHRIHWLRVQLRHQSGTKDRASSIQSLLAQIRAKAM